MVQGFKGFFAAFLLATSAFAAEKVSDNAVSGRDLVTVASLACDSASKLKLTRWAASANFYDARVSMDGIKNDNGAIRAKRHAVKLEQKDGRFILATNGRKVTGQNICELIVNFAESEAAEKVSLFSALVPSAHAQNALDQMAAASNASPTASANANSNSPVATSNETVASPAAPATAETVAAPASANAETSAAPATTEVTTASAPTGPEMVASPTGGTPSDQLPPPGTTKYSLSGGNRGTSTLPSSSRSPGKQLTQVANDPTSQVVAAAAAAVATGAANANSDAVAAIAAVNGSLSADSIRQIVSNLNDRNVKVSCHKRKVRIKIAGTRILVNKTKNTVRVLGSKKKSSTEIPNQAEILALAKTCSNKAQARELENKFITALRGTTVAVETSIASAAQSNPVANREPASNGGGGAMKEAKRAQ